MAMVDTCPDTTAEKPNAKYQQNNIGETDGHVTCGR